MMPSRTPGGMTQSPSSSGIFFQGENSSNFTNSLNSLPLHSRSAMCPNPISGGDISATILNSVSSNPSVGASSLVTDANSALSGGGPHLQRSASINADSSYNMRLPASPMSFSSNNISLSNSSAIDGSSVVQSSATSSRIGQVRVPNPYAHDPSTLKKPRLDIKQEDSITQHQVLQQLLLQRQDLQNPNSNPQFQALIQQQRLRQQQQQQQQILQAMPPMQRVQLLQQQQVQQQLQLRQQIQQQVQQPVSGIKRPYDGGVCSRRLMQYMYHQRQRPTENPIAYWRKFVAEYYSPRAKKRWCLSLYENVGHHSLGVFPQAAMDVWQCDICGSKSGKGFEATCDVLPRLNEIKFGSGVIDELLFLDLPRECRFPSGMMMLEYGKAVQESVYEQLRVVREGQLRIVFTPDLKILSWEFCARRHEELLPRRLVAPQVNQLLQVAQKCHTTLSESGPEGVSQQDLQANSVMVVNAGRQLARSMELQSLNDLGFSKRYVRCLQIAEVVSSMKDLMDICTQKKIGAIEGLKNFPRHATPPRPQIQEPEQTSSRPTTDHNTLNKLMALHNTQINGNNQHTVNPGSLTGSAHAALALTNYQSLLTRQNSMNLSYNNNNNNINNNNSLQHEPSSSPSNLASPSSTTILAGKNAPIGGFYNSQLPQQNQSQTLQQQMMQQMLLQQQSLSGGGNVNRDGLSFGRQLSRNTSFKSGSNSESPVVSGNNNIGFGQKTSDLTNNLHGSDDIGQDIVHEFTENGFFGNDLDDNMNFSWNA